MCSYMLCLMPGAWLHSAENGLIKALDQFGARSAADIPTPEIIVNHASGVEEGKGVAAKLRAICERFLARSPRQAGWLPRSNQVERSGSQQAPFSLGTRRGLEQLCMEQMASRLVRLAGRGEAHARTAVHAGGALALAQAPGAGAR